MAPTTLLLVQERSGRVLNSGRRLAVIDLLASGTAPQLRDALPRPQRWPVSPASSAEQAIETSETLETTIIQRLRNETPSRRVGVLDRAEITGEWRDW